MATASSFWTLPPTRRQLVSDELARARAFKEDFIDTDFYSGFMQRENRDIYVTRLTAELKSIDDSEGRKEGAEEVVRRESLHARAGAAEAERKRQEAAIIEAIYPGYRGRKAQFKYRLGRLAEQIQACEDARLRCIGERAVLAQRLNVTQARSMEVQAEADRIAALHGGQVNSSVMHGADQTFPVKVLRRLLREELELCSKNIASDKLAVMEGNEEAVRMLALREQREAELKERQAALAVFNRNVGRALTMGIKVKILSTEDLK
ncbi:unnamed protein product, partial [Phaeothamnion confervicola]